MANLDQIVEEVSKLSALELSDLVKKIEEKFGVSAAMPVMSIAGGAGAGEEAKEEKQQEPVVKEKKEKPIPYLKVFLIPDITF